MKNNLCYQKYIELPKSGNHGPADSTSIQYSNFSIKEVNVLLDKVAWHKGNIKDFKWAAKAKGHLGPS